MFVYEHMYIHTHICNMRPPAPKFLSLLIGMYVSSLYINTKRLLAVQMYDLGWGHPLHLDVFVYIRIYVYTYICIYIYLHVCI